MISKTSDAFVISRSEDPKRVFMAFAKIISASGSVACNELIMKDYIQETTLRSDYIIAVGHNVTRTLRSGKKQYDFSSIKGFALITQPSKDSLYIDLICGKGIGRVLFNKIYELSFQLNVSKIKLSALPEAMMRYHQAYGFKFSNSCNESALISEKVNRIKNANNAVKTAVMSGTTGSKSKKSAAIRKQQSKSKRELQGLEHLLSNMDIVYNKGCKVPKKCSVSGYTMTKCLK